MTNTTTQKNAIEHLKQLRNEMHKIAKEHDISLSVTISEDEGESLTTSGCIVNYSPKTLAMAIITLLDNEEQGMKLAAHILSRVS